MREHAPVGPGSAKPLLSRVQDLKNDGKKHANRSSAIIAFLAGLIALALLVSALYPADPVRDRINQHINLGKAFYENPGTAKEAVEEFRQALALVPNSPREKVNYGLALLRAGRTTEGIAQLERASGFGNFPQVHFSLGVAYKREGDFNRALREFTETAKLVPDEPVTHYNLGTIYKALNQNEKAIAEFETAARLDLTLAAPHFQLFNAYRTTQKTEQAQRELAIFQEIKKRQSETGATEDMDWSPYSEILDDAHALGSDSDSSALVDVAFEDQRLGSVGVAGAGIAALDADGDGKLDLIAWSAERVVLFHNTGRGFTAMPVEGARGAVFIGDFNNDGLPDLCVLTSSEAQLWVNQKGAFVKSAKPLASGAFHKALWIDYDHDYDLDLMLLGEKQVLLRNNGDGSWADVSSSFPFVAGEALDAAVLELGENANTFDVVVSYRGRQAVLYRDRKVAHYEAEALPFPLLGALEVGDFNQDGLLDLAAIEPGRVTFIQTRGVDLQSRKAFPKGPDLQKGPEMRVPPGARILAGDFENRGRTDWLVSGELRLHRSGFIYTSGKARGAPGNWVAAAAGDFNNDGLTDAAMVFPDGSVHLLANKAPRSNNWLTVALAGVKNLKLASGARVEVKAGELYEKKVYQGVPLVFGLGHYTQADTVRITWPNGLIQNEIRQKTGVAYNYKEAPRLSGSCPMIFTWNGRSFEFISDVLGVAPMGAGLSDGDFFPLDHQEYVQIPGRSLALRNGVYEIHMTEELREVSYLDQIKLIAVDHPAGVEIFTNEKFKSPPFPDFRLFGVERRIYPKTAWDDQRRDVRELILRRDGRYPDKFDRDLNGRAETHSLTLDFGNAPQHPVLFLHGWVDWADGSTFVAASQSKAGTLVMPYLQVKDHSGAWKTVIEDMGMPAGKPKTIAVDLAGKFLSSSRQVRIVTNLCVYWDEIFLGENVLAGSAPGERAASDDRFHLAEMLPAAADVHFRGFSVVRIDPQRRQPEQFDYSQVRPVSMWNPTPGLYTRYGDVTLLLQSVDDRFVIMGSGDELRMQFSPAALPPLPQGWTRDFLILVDGWAKDADANTAFGSSVEPLPFHAMRGYPYSSSEHYPDDAMHNDYRRAYNTRPALRLIRPLAASNSANN